MMHNVRFFLTPWRKHCLVNQVFVKQDQVSHIISQSLVHTYVKIGHSQCAIVNKNKKMLRTYAIACYPVFTTHSEILKKDRYPKGKTRDI